jgi:chaperonin GroES
VLPPLYNSILTVPLPPAHPKNQTAGGILLPDSGKKTNEGEVVSVGPGAVGRDGKLLPVHVAAGDRVLLPEYGGHTIKVGDEELHLYRDEDILAKLA